jgi:hypothetical protein
VETCRVRTQSSRELGIIHKEGKQEKGYTGLNRTVDDSINVCFFL